MSPTKVSVRSERLLDPAAVRARLDAAGAKAGWICFTSGWVAWWPGGEEVAPAGRDGLPLSAELVLSPTSSLQLRQDGDGWLVTTVTEGEGAEAQRRDRTFVSSLGQAKHLNYRTYWTLAEAGEGVREWRPHAALFAGFDAGGAT